MDNLERLIDALPLSRTINQWEVKKTTRSLVEAQFCGFTGFIDIYETHVPYTEYQLIKRAFKAVSKRSGKSLCVFAGDSLNLDLFSRFSQESTDNSLPSNEIDDMVELLKLATKVYDKVVYMATNHERRMEKVIINAIPCKTKAKEIIKRMESIEQTFEKAGLKIVYVNNWFLQIGDALICHAEANRTVTGSLSRELVSYFKPRIKKPFNVIFQAHTHNQSAIPVDRVLVIETGAMIGSLDYWVDGKLKGNRKFGTIGYGTGYMDKGKCDLNSCRFVISDWQDHI